MFSSVGVLLVVKEGCFDAAAVKPRAFVQCSHFWTEKSDVDTPTNQDPQD
jgi:hypothetical protein